MTYVFFHIILMLKFKKITRLNFYMCNIIINYYQKYCKI